MRLHPAAVHVGAASLNQTVGDWSGNFGRILAVIAEARRRGVRLLVLPEMAIPGYSMGDRLLRRGTLARSWEMLEKLAPHTAGMVVCVGLPVQHRGVVYNAIAVVGDGRIGALACKENLAVGDVEYENRWYQPWSGGVLEDFEAPDGRRIPIGTAFYQAAGIGRFAVEICEDGWKGIRPGSIYALAGALILCNPSASWFTLGKHAVRRGMVEQISREDHCAYLYTSLLGCDSTRLVFDGTVLVGENGRIKCEGRRFLFNEDFELVDRLVDLDAIRLTRREEGSWRQQAFDRQPPTMIELEGDFGGGEVPPAPPPWWIPAPPGHPDPSLAWVEGVVGHPVKAEDLPHLELELGLTLALRDYLKKSKIPRITLALSGGRDSSMVAVLAQRMVAYENPGVADLRPLVRERLTTAYLATANSGPVTETAARVLAEDLGAKHLFVEMQQAVDVHVDLVQQMTGQTLSWERHDVPLQNVQARLRGSLIWFIANLEGGLLLATSNQSEAAVGYATMDGDTSGGIAPLADVPKSLITLWLRWARDFHGIASLDLVNEQQPTAELRPPDKEQTDEGDLMPFRVLDRLMYHFVQLGQDPLEMFRSLWPAVAADYRDPRRFAADIRKFVRLFCFAQWKRERFAISFRVTAFDLDPKTGFRFPPVQAPFTEELAELDAYVAALGS